MAGVEEYCKEWHLEVNVDKTKVMVTSKEGDKVPMLCTTRLS